MEMFLMALALSLLGVTVSAIAFAAAANANAVEPEREFPVRVEPLAEHQAGFFIESPPPAPARPVPIEALLLQIERHIRLEHAAAEAFQQAPTPELLHIRTASPLVH